MRIGYPCINRTLKCSPNHTVRLASWTPERFIKLVSDNLTCLKEILAYNVHHQLLFFRIGSGLVPFASHPVCTVDWEKSFSEPLREIGKFIKAHTMRISMHPDQFTLLTARDDKITERSINELRYHAAVLDAMRLDTSARIQIHVGGVYGDADASISRFIHNWRTLPKSVKKRCVIENDDRLYSARQCLDIHKKTGIPVLFDSLHHSLNNNGERLRDMLEECAQTWSSSTDGPPMVDYSSQKTGARPGSHTESIDPHHFALFLQDCHRIEFDLMLEIKDKERSALIALEIAKREGVVGS